MKILIVGATGTIGKFVTSALSERHEIVKAGSKSGDVQVDIKEAGSIRKMFDKVGSSTPWSRPPAMCISASSPR